MEKSSVPLQYLIDKSGTLIKPFVEYVAKLNFVSNTLFIVMRFLS